MAVVILNRNEIFSQKSKNLKIKKTIRKTFTQFDNEIFIYREINFFNTRLYKYLNDQTQFG